MGTVCLPVQGKESLHRQAGWVVTQLLRPVALSVLIHQDAAGLSKCRDNMRESASKTHMMKLREIYLTRIKSFVDKNYKTHLGRSTRQV